MGLTSAMCAPSPPPMRTVAATHISAAGKWNRIGQQQRRGLCACKNSRDSKPRELNALSCVLYPLAARPIRDGCASLHWPYVPARCKKSFSPVDLSGCDLHADGDALLWIIPGPPSSTSNCRQSLLCWGHSATRSLLPFSDQERMRRAVCCIAAAKGERRHHRRWKSCSLKVCRLHRYFRVTDRSR